MAIKARKQKIDFIKDMVKLNARVSYSGTSSGIISLAAAKAASLLKSKIFFTSVFVSPYIYLNSAHIGVPKLGRCGLRKIVAAGLVVKNPSLGLHVMGDLTLDQIKKINELTANPTLVNVEVQFNTKPIFCRVVAVDDKQNVADVTIANDASTFVSVKFNNKESITEAQRQALLKRSGFATVDQAIDYVTCQEAYELCKLIPLKELSFLDEHIRMNSKICEEGEKLESKTTIHHGLRKALKYLAEPKHCFDKNHWTAKLLYLITGGIDARMGGCPFPAMTSATNGDHGIVAVMTPLFYGKTFHVDKERIYQSILLAHFITWKISIKIGKLCTMCGTAIAAVAGALAAIALQNDMPWEKVQNLLNMHLAQQAGTMCYGSSNSCAFQVMCAIATGLSAYSLVDHGGKVPHRDGIVHDDFEITLNNLKHFTDGTKDDAINTVVGIYQKESKEGNK